MISYEAMIVQMAQLVQNAKHAQDEQQMREQLTAVKALCDIVLGQRTVKVEQTTMSTATVQLPVMRQANPSDKLQESDANGDSIFDF
ncbi:YwdI family protein [Lysinibacillus sp. KU-BSD001]|uniref:YwdI family protein n=1 Tax=Lysinibacillus sp. KU-BSD001 TaxID=3141328 RepID=UPI0036EE5859